MFHGAVAGKQLAWGLISHPFRTGEALKEGFVEPLKGEKGYNDLMSAASMANGWVEIQRLAGGKFDGESANSRYIQKLAKVLTRDGVDPRDIRDLYDRISGYTHPDDMEFASQIPVIKEMEDMATSRGIKDFEPRTFREYVADLVQQDEMMQGPDIMKGWVGALMRYSKHSFYASKDLTRMKLFADKAAILEKSVGSYWDNPKPYQDLAKSINMMTGYGEFKSATANDVLNTLGAVMWAPRYMKAKIDAFNPAWYIGAFGKVDPVVAKMNRVEGYKLIASQIGTLSAAAMFGKAIGITNVGIDPRDEKNSFGTVQIGGRRYEIPGGYVPYVRWAAKEMMSMYHFSTGTQSRDEKNPVQIAGDFWRNKLSPEVSLAYDLISGSTFRGEKVNPANPKDLAWAIGQRYLPFIVPDLWEDYKDYKDTPPELRESKTAIGIGTGLRQLGVGNYPAQSKPTKMANVHADNPLGLEQIRARVNTPTPVRKFDPETRQPEEMSDFVERRRREAEYWPKYGLQLVQNEQWKTLTPVEKKDALNSLRYRVAREAGQKEPAEYKLDPDVIIGAVLGGELSKEEKRQQRLGSRVEMTGGLRSP